MAVNWELHDGDAVERFAAALILLDNPRGNRITPSRGDRGVDIRLDNPDGTDIWQVKRYTRPLSSSQRTEIQGSWNRFVEQVLPTTRIRSWTLVTPWDPSTERREWLMELTDSVTRDFTIGWLGRSQLDVMAAARPELADYFFGDGNRRTQELMAEALRGGRETPPDSQGEGLLDAVVARHLVLTRSLNEVDPFYRYELEIRNGHVDGTHWELENSRGAMWIAYAQIAEDQYRVLRLYPLCEESRWLRPVSFDIELQAPIGSPDHQAIERFHDYGAPLTDVLGVVTSVSGPPGAMMPPGEGLFSAFAVDRNPGQLPEIEARVVDADGSLVAAVELTGREVSRGIAGSGLRIAGSDRAGFLHVEALVGAENRRLEALTWRTTDVGGLAPRDVLPAAELLVGVRPGRRAQLAFRDGPSFTGPGWELTESAPQNFEELVELCRALIEIQGHTATRITFPTTISESWINHVHTVLRIIRGEAIERPWHGVDVVAESSTSSPEWLADGEFQLLRDEILTLTIGDQEIETDVRIQFHALSARLVEVAPLPDHGLDATHSRFVPGTNSTGIFRALAGPQATDWVRGRYRVAQIAPS